MPLFLKKNKLKLKTVNVKSSIVKFSKVMFEIMNDRAFSTGSGSANRSKTPLKRIRKTAALIRNVVRKRFGLDFAVTKRP